MISKQQTTNYLWLDYSLHRLNDTPPPKHPTKKPQKQILTQKKQREASGGGGCGGRKLVLEIFLRTWYSNSVTGGKEKIRHTW
jgi:hypothetical protein